MSEPLEPSAQMKQLIEDVQKHPDDYEGCTLCFGRGFIWEFTVESDLSTMFRKTFIRCPRCEGNQVCKTCGF